MIHEFKTHFTGDFDLQLFEFLVGEFNNLPVGDIDHVVMMTFLTLGLFVPCLAISEITFADNVYVLKETHGPIDGGN